jgi:hypothetical protein
MPDKSLGPPVSGASRTGESVSTDDGENIAARAIPADWPLMVFVKSKAFTAAR